MGATHDGKGDTAAANGEVEACLASIAFACANFVLVAAMDALVAEATLEDELNSAVKTLLAILLEAAGQVCLLTSSLMEI